MSEWISVKDRMPLPGWSVLALNNGSMIFQASLKDGEWSDDQNSWVLHDVTHWMPLPKPPESESE